MFRNVQLVSLVASALFASFSIAQAPAGAPAGATGLCKDGTYWTGATKRGACHGHKGVQDWYASADAAAGGTATAPAAAAPAAVPASPQPAAPKAAATPAAGQAPAGATGLCKDGTYWTGATKRGACHGHKGVQDWYASADAAAGGTATAPAAVAPAAAAPAATAPAAAPASPRPAATKAAATPAAEAAPGGGPGMVWVNTNTNVYHCSSDRWYGKTKQGAYMSEADAIAKGNRADHGKPCSK